jgi:signal transduction histidine kinase
MSELLDLYQGHSSSVHFAELHEVVQPTLEQVTRALGYSVAFVALVDVEQEILEGVAGVAAPEALIDLLPGLLVQTLRLGKPLRVDDTLHDPRLGRDLREECLSLGMLAFAVIPLLPASAALVVSRNHPIEDADLNELIPFTGQLATAIAARREVRELRESGEQNAIEKEWLWWMVNAVQDPVLLTDQNNTVILSNVHAERLLKANPDDREGKRRAIQINNTLLSSALSRFTLDPGISEERELTLVDPIEGNDLLFEVICQTATNLRTGERGLVSVLKDVTDLGRAESELKRSLASLEAADEQVRRERDQLDLILSNVADPIVVTDPAGQIILMNGPAERLLQGQASPANEPLDTISRSNWAKLSSVISRLRLEASTVRQDELQLVHPVTFEALTMSVTATEVADALGQVTAIVSVLHDLTKLRELEQQTLRQQLFESEKLAAVGRLAATVAHEINNPLEAIKNALYLVVSGLPADDQNRRFLEIASKETERVSRIIRNMLGMFRQTPDKVPTDVNAVVQEAIALLQRPLRQQQVVVRLDLHPDLPRIMASADQLKQVFLNLILNAQDTMPRGGLLEVSTQLSRETDTEFLAGRYVLVQVRDTGGGIAEEDIPRIFEPFYSTKTDSKGTGLGLWVSMGIVQNHGGQIKVRSRRGRGTTFTIALPPEGSAT